MATMILTLTIPDGEAAHDAAMELLPSIIDAAQEALDTREALQGSSVVALTDVVIGWKCPDCGERRSTGGTVPRGWRIVHRDKPALLCAACATIAQS